MVNKFCLPCFYNFSGLNLDLFEQIEVSHVARSAPFILSLNRIIQCACPIYNTVHNPLR